jgi:hypothetical protein
MPPVLAVLLAAGSAQAGPISAEATALHAMLADESGWDLVREEDGVQVSRKAIAGTGMQAWKGTKEFPPGTDSDAVFARITDTEAHLHISPGLIASKIVKREGTGALYYQVLDAPLPLSDRYWIARSASFEDVGGKDGHHRRTWSSVGPANAAAVRSELQERYPRAVEVPETHGRWDLVPLTTGGLRVTYRSVVDPGGAVPQGLANSVAGRGVADNINRMVAASSK